MVCHSGNCLLLRDCQEHQYARTYLVLRSYSRTIACHGFSAASNHGHAAYRYSKSEYCPCLECTDGDLVVVVSLKPTSLLSDSSGPWSKDGATTGPVISGGF